MKRKLIIIAAVAITLSFGISMAMAWDFQTYPASMCKAYNGDQQDDVKYYNGGIQNESSSMRLITCPIIRNQVFEDFDLISFAGWNATGQDAKVKYRMRSSTGASGGAKDRSATNNGNWTVIFEDDDMPDIDLYYYYALIELGAGSRVWQIHTRSYEE